MLKSIIIACRILLGLIFLVFVLNGFYTFIPVPEFHPFMEILVSSGYIYLIKSVEVVAGVLLLSNRFVPLALTLLGADIANIVAYHVLLDGRNWQIAPVVGLLWLVLVIAYWYYFAVLLTNRTAPFARTGET
jgi:hypothetical protein